MQTETLRESIACYPLWSNVGDPWPMNHDRGRSLTCKTSPLFVSLLLILMAFISQPLQALGVEITPFYTQNQSPVAQIFGLPAAGDAKLLSRGTTCALVAVDVASNFATNATPRESIILDGESYRYTLGLRYGITDRLEAGIDIPYVGQGGGFLDGFIIGWHRFFGLPQGGREDAPRNRLLYSYEKDGSNRLLVNDSGFDVGDVRFYGALQIYDDGEHNPRTVALRASIKAPTGDSDHLHGSGSTDFALWLTASDDYRLPAWLGHFTCFGAMGGMAMTKGNVLREDQRNVAGFGTFGFGWGPAEWIAFKAQVSGHTPFYKSDLRELGGDALQLIVGGTLAFSPWTTLDIGVSEDVIVSTSPDVAFHLALKRLF
jgi:hypothetical protein